MKQFFYITIFSFSTLFFYGQSSSVDQPKAPGIYLSDGTKVNEYKKTFEMKHIANPDQAMLSKIDVSKYWKFMDQTKRVEVIDNETNQTLILYSREESNALIDFKTVLVVMPPDFSRGETKTH